MERKNEKMSSDPINSLEGEWKPDRVPLDLFFVTSNGLTNAFGNVKLRVVRWGSQFSMPFQCKPDGAVRSMLVCR